MSQSKFQPFLKWPGGKRWLVDRIANAISVPEGNKYIEPFLGSGAVFFAVQPTQALLSDINEELIELFIVMRDKPNELRKKLIYHNNHHNHDYYYSIRSMHPRTDVGKAARTLYLNRTCFNGMYRVNKLGCFNVPIGSKTNCIYDVELFNNYSEILHAAQINKSDFENTISKADAGDFIFADPPYAVSNKEVFTKYNDKLFVWEDQLRLFNSLVEAQKRGANIISTNIYCEELMKLYIKAGFFIRKVNRVCSIAGNPEKRKQVTELIISTNEIGDKKWQE